jgi:mRNA interferase RelE/StbE
MGWRIEIPSSSQRELDALPDSVWREVIKAIADLGEDPFPPGCIRLRGHTGLYRVRAYFDRYRIVHHVSEKQDRVIVERRLRGSAYRGL